MIDISKMEPIDGSPVVNWQDASEYGGPASLVETEDGRLWYWYFESDTNYGEWREYKH